MKDRQDLIAAILLDLGNVVLDWDVDRILESIGASPSEQDLLRSELFGHQDWLDMDHGKKTESYVVDAVCGRSALNRNIVEKSLLAAKTSLETIPETIRLLNELNESRIEVYCLSNMSVETYEFIRHRSFFQKFEGIVISGVEGFMKPEREIFELAIKRFDLAIESTLFIDDSPANIAAARALGIESILFTRTEACYSEIRSRLHLPMTIRLATKEDAQRIHDLHNESVRQLCIQYSNKVIEGWLKNRSPEGYKGIGKNEIYVFELDSEVIGFSHVVPGEIIALFVDPDHARKGVGSALMKHALPLAKKNWNGPITIKATLNAVPFYEAHDFKKIRDTITRRNDVEFPSAVMESIEE